MLLLQMHPHLPPLPLRRRQHLHKKKRESEWSGQRFFRTSTPKTAPVQLSSTHLNTRFSYLHDEHIMLAQTLAVPINKERGTQLTPFCCQCKVWLLLRWLESSGLARLGATGLMRGSHPHCRLDSIDSEECRGKFVHPHILLTKEPRQRQNEPIHMIMLSTSYHLDETFRR